MLLIRLLMLAGVISLIALSSFLLPSPDERITMLIRDHKTDSAYDELISLFNKGEREPHLLHQLTILHEQFGNVEAMKKTLLASLEHRSDDRVMREKLIELYFYTHDKYGYIEQLERHIDFHGGREQVDRLLGYHKTLGNVQEEMRLSRKYLFKPFFSNDHTERFVMLLLNTGREAEGIVVFKKMDDLSHQADRHWNTRATMFRYLIEKEQIGEAFERAERWVAQKSARNDHIIGMIEYLSARGLGELALSLGETALPHHPELTFSVASKLVQKKRYDIARQRLDQWQQSHPIKTDQRLMKYVDAVLQAQDLRAALTALNNYGFARAPQPALLNLAEELIDQNQIPLLKTVRPFLSKGGLDTRPILAARIAMLEGHKNKARALLGVIDVATLQKDQSRTWLDVYQQAFGLKAAYWQMNKTVAQRKLPLSLLRDYAELANLLGRPIQSPWVWAKLGGRFPLNTPHSLSEAKDASEKLENSIQTFDLASNF